MFLGALVDAGAPVDAIQSAVDAVGVEPVAFSVEAVTRQGLAATRVHVKVGPSSVVRTWGNIRGMIEAAALAPGVRRLALDVFARLARAEARAHRTTPEQVHFHEVGALDAIADVVGTSAALDALGVTSAVSGPVCIGHGMVRAAHGLLPVPAPAVVELLAEARAPVYGGDAPYEMCTPTGAALLAATASGWGPLPPMRVTASGWGAGARDLDELPNVLRVVLGEPEPAGAPGEGEAVLLSTNVDDLDPRLWPPVISALLAAGAADAWLTPILMKKGRPAHTLSVLVAPDRVDEVRRTIFAETSTIGLRAQTVGKIRLDRVEHTVSVDGVPVRVKAALLDGEVVNAQPEYEDVAAAAARLGRPAKAALAAAIAAAEAGGPPAQPGPGGGGDAAG
jgi:uncharacterized protein (TIGR00299 family) protein